MLKTSHKKYRAPLPPVAAVVLAPAQLPSTAPAQATSTAPAQAPSTAPAQAPSTAPAQAPSTAPAQAPSTAPAQAPSTAPAQAPSTAPAQASSTASTPAPAQVPSTSPSLAPAAASAAPSPSMAPVGEKYDDDFWPPPPPEVFNFSTDDGDLDNKTSESISPTKSLRLHIEGDKNFYGGRYKIDQFSSFGHDINNHDDSDDLNSNFDQIGVTSCLVTPVKLTRDFENNNNSQLIKESIEKSSQHNKDRGKIQNTKSADIEKISRSESLKSCTGSTCSSVSAVNGYNSNNNNNNSHVETIGNNDSIQSSISITKCSSVSSSSACSSSAPSPLLVMSSSPSMMSSSPIATPARYKFQQQQLSQSKMMMTSNKQADSLQNESLSSNSASPSPSSSISRMSLRTLTPVPLNCDDSQKSQTQAYPTTIQAKKNLRNSFSSNVSSSPSVASTSPLPPRVRLDNFRISSYYDNDDRDSSSFSSSRRSSSASSVSMAQCLLFRNSPINTPENDSSGAGSIININGRRVSGIGAQAFEANRRSLSNTLANRANNQRSNNVTNT